MKRWKVFVQFSVPCRPGEWPTSTRATSRGNSGVDARVTTQKPTSPDDVEQDERLGEPMATFRPYLASVASAALLRTILKERLQCSVLCAQRIIEEPLQHFHWALALLKRWWLGTHHGAIRGRYAQAYLDEFVFRYNRRKTRGMGRLVARVPEREVVAKPPITNSDTKSRRVSLVFRSNNPRKQSDRYGQMSPMTHYTTHLKCEKWGH